MVKIKRNMDIAPKEDVIRSVVKEKKNKFSASRLAIVLFLVILTAGATGGVMWYFMDQVNTINRKTIDDLRNQISKISDEVKEDNEKEDDNDKDDLVYKNSEYGFEMELTKNWEGYKVFKYVDSQDDSALAYYYVAMPTEDKEWDESPRVDDGYASIFALSVYTKQQWQEANSSEYILSGGEFIVENDEYVIAWSHSQDGPSEAYDDTSTFSKANDDINLIISSIEFVK